MQNWKTPDLIERSNNGKKDQPRDVKCPSCKKIHTMRKGIHSTGAFNVCKECKPDS